MIQLKNIVKTYVMGSNEVKALKGVSVSFRKNEFVAILGPSGGGKTTLLNIVGGLDKYTSGDLIINGKSTVEFKDRDWDSYRNHSVGFVFQSYNLIPHQTVLSNVELALTISGDGKKNRKEKAIKALEAVGLGDQIYKKPNQLSGGQMQRVAIARALVNNPDIVLADEPTGALDTQSSIQIMDLLKEIAKDRLVVMVTHNPELAQEYASRIVRIKDGQIISDSNPFEQDDELSFVGGKTKMGLMTALSLSINNLLTKRGRTILTAFAGSIGIIGIALILSLSSGVNKYIDEVQENSLSSYPLTIQNNTADVSSIMSAMMGSITNTEKAEGTISEMPLAADMFEQIGKNNLKEFKRWLDDNSAVMKELTSAIMYDYGSRLQIYKSDTSEKIIQLSPSQLSSRGMVGMSFGDTFQRMIDNETLLHNQYEVIAGRWPSKYDECVLVLHDKYSISDYSLYTLGIRDPKELSDLISEVFKGEHIKLENKTMSFDYDYFLNMTFKVVLPTDRYKYNEEYDIWENMSDDEDFMKKVIADSLDLKVVGILCPNKDASSTSLQSGVAYLSSLETYVIDKVSEKAIVKEQLADKDKDVFSRKSFDELNEGDNNSGLNFSDMISIDKDKIKKAFGGTVSEEEIKNKVTKYINEAVSSISVDTSEVSASTYSTFRNMAIEMFNHFITNHGLGNGMAMINESDITLMVDEYMQTNAALNNINALTTPYGLDGSLFKEGFGTMLQYMVGGYYQASLAMGVPCALVSDQVEVLVDQLAPNFAEGLQQIANGLAEAKMKMEVGSIMGTMSGDLIGSVASAFKIDPDMLAEAFKFDMDEDELSRLMSTYMSGNYEESAERNLSSLGYGELDNPTNINIYFNDFKNKDTFKDMVKDYNDQKEKIGQEESVIIYTDITGILMSSITTIINAISYVLIAFVSISLVVSSIMIGIITYISVLERTKEIGILRAMGASKKDVGNIFSAETFIIGLLSGALGIGVTLLLLIPANMIIRSVTNITSLKAYLPTNGGMGLIIISIILSLIAGMIPSKMATKCDPVVALRSE